MKGWTAGRSTIGTAALAVAAACAGGTTGRQPAGAPSLMPAPASPAAQILLAEAEIRVIAEIMLMEDRRSLDLLRIEALAAHWSPRVRRRAALALGRVREPAGARVLRDLADDPDEGVRTDAVFALGLIGDSSNATIGLLAGLARQHPADSLGTEAVASLAKAGSTAAFDSLVALTRSSAAGMPSPVLAEALVSYWRFGRRAEAALAVTGPFVESADPDTRWRAIYPFVRNGIAGAASLYLELADDPAHAVRAQALRALRAPLADSAGIRDEALVTLRAALGDAHPHVRINALGALSSYREATLAPAIAPLVDDADGNVRMAAVQALGPTGGPAATAILARVTDAEAEKIGIRIAALGALAGLDPGRATSAAKEWAASDRWLHRLVAARLLASSLWPEAGETLAELARDGDVRVARAAIAAISRSADDRSAQAHFLVALRSPAPQVRAAAIGAIARRGSGADLAVLLDAYEESLADSVTDAAVAAVDGLATLARNGSPVANAFFSRFAPHRSAQVRRAVAARIGDGWGDAPSDGTVHGLGFYEDVVRELVAPALAGEPPPLLRITTLDGPIDVELAAADAPLTVRNIIDLVESGYYDADGDGDARRWHRVVPNFVLQDGEPAGDGSGSPGYAIRDEINRIRYDRGVLGMALSGPDTGSGQFFITHSPQPHLDGGYTIFGRVVNGMEIADAVVQDDRIVRMEIIRR